MWTELGGNDERPPLGPSWPAERRQVANALGRPAGCDRAIGPTAQLAMAWPALLQELVVREPGESQQAQLLGQLAAEFRRDGTPIIKLVEALGPWLTGEDDAQRARATGVLSEVRGCPRWRSMFCSFDGMDADAAEPPWSLAAAAAAVLAAVPFKLTTAIPACSPGGGGCAHSCGQ